MQKVEFPAQLKALLEDTELYPPIRNLADRASAILADNKLAFFPDYTDHGVEHINCVLKTEIELVPPTVWDRSKPGLTPRLLNEADAAVLIGATLLHDIAMHLTVPGFRELVGEASRFRPLRWFRDDHENHTAEIPWHELWQDFVREAKRLNQRDLTNIVGEESARDWKFDGLPDDPGEWQRNDYLIVGEFIRRHHARLAHEIAIYGFPGLPAGNGEGQFPAMGSEPGHLLIQLADLIGLAARSHGVSLRLCEGYLNAHYPRTPRPNGTVVFYPMALLRVADYLQIDKKRAPAVLLNLRDPQSPISVQEWQKHLAVIDIGPGNDPHGKIVTVANNVRLSIYLQLKDLIDGLQAEMDHATAVLGEIYGARADLGLDQLTLAIRRVDSNLSDPGYRASLPYVPRRTGFAADPNLLTLLVEPLYGQAPAVGVRELIQNGADAVRELKVWCETHGTSTGALDLPKQDADVLVEYIKRDDGSWFLRITDRGIGMTADTIEKYFLRAGASFRRSPEWAKEFVDDNGKARVLRAGRFGIGAFAIFLLGEKFRLWTRHAGAPKGKGYNLEAAAHSQLIDIRRTEDAAIGTRIEVDLSGTAVEQLRLNAPSFTDRYGVWVADWYCWDWPSVRQRIDRDGMSTDLEPAYAIPVCKEELPAEWNVIYPEGFDAVYWTVARAPAISCNGIVLGRAPGPIGQAEVDSWDRYETGVDPPPIAVLDGAANLPVTTQRYQLSGDLPFTVNLMDDLNRSFVAHALVCGPETLAETFSRQRRFPRSVLRTSTYSGDKLGPLYCPKSWCATKAHFVPVEARLVPLLHASSLLVMGGLWNLGFDWSDEDENTIHVPEHVDCAFFRWEHSVGTSGGSQTQLRVISSVAAAEFTNLQGAVAAKHTVAAFVPRKSYLDISVQLLEMGWSMRHESERAQHFDSPGEPSPALELAVKSFNFTPETQLRLIAAYAAEYAVQDGGVSSPLAELWLECLGPTAIPFDPVEREQLIARAASHPKLARHIESWKILKAREADKKNG